MHFPFARCVLKLPSPALCPDIKERKKYNLRKANIHTVSCHAFSVFPFLVCLCLGNNLLGKCHWTSLHTVKITNKYMRAKKENIWSVLILNWDNEKEIWKDSGPFIGFLIRKIMNIFPVFFSIPSISVAIFSFSGDMDWWSLDKTAKTENWKLWPNFCFITSHSPRDWTSDETKYNTKGTWG